MAALTATFEHSVQGNKRVEYATVTGGLGSSSDTIAFPLGIITGAVDFVFTAAAGGATVSPVVAVATATATVTLSNGTTGIAFVCSAEGR